MSAYKTRAAKEMVCQISMNDFLLYEIELDAWQCNTLPQCISDVVLLRARMWIENQDH